MIWDVSHLEISAPHNKGSPLDCTALKHTNGNAWMAFTFKSEKKELCETNSSSTLNNSIHKTVIITVCLKLLGGCSYP